MIPWKRIPHLLPALCLTAALFLQPSAVAQDDKYREDISKAEAALNRRNYEGALTAYKDALKDSRSFTGANLATATFQANFGLSRAYLGLGAFKNAIQSCDEALKSASGNPNFEILARNQRGLALVASASKAGDPILEQAVTEFQKVLALDDKDPIVSYNLGVALLRLNRDAEGIHELQMFVARAGRTPDAETARRLIDEPRRARENFAPPFSITTKTGEYITLDDLKGKVVLLDFWGTWCGPCREATPSLVRYSNKHSSEVFVMIGVAVNESNEQGWREYIDKNKMNWPQYLDSTRKISALFNVTAYPTYITIDSEGIIRDRRSGWSTEQMNNLDEQVKRAGKLKSAPKLAKDEAPDRGNTVPSMPPAPMNFTPTSTAAATIPAAAPAPVITPAPPLPATPVAKTADPNTSGGVTVSGRVIRSGEPAVAQAVPVPTANRANLVRPGNPPLTTTVVIAPDGTFEFRNVQPGSYILNIGIPVPTQPITVGGSDVRGLEFEAPNVHSVPVRITTDGLSAVVPRPLFTIIYRNGTMSIGTGSFPDGSVRILLPEGEHRIVPNIAGFTVKSLTYGSIDLLKDPLKIGPGDTEDLVVALVANPGAVATPGRGAPPQGVAVQGGRGTVLPEGATPQRGTRGLPPGRTPPTVQSRVEPQYTDAARQAKIQGTVVLRTVVRKDGTVGSVQVLQGLGYGLDESAVSAIRQWKFLPATQNGEAIELTTSMEVTFSLQ
jgi:TonB family protein